MQIHRIGGEVSGFRQMSEYAIRMSRMVSEQAKERARVLRFWKRHGLGATLDAFPVCRRTLFGWKRRLREEKGRLSGLNIKDRAPRRRRTRLWPIDIVRQIQIIRFEHPNLGKEKIHPFLKEFCEKRGLACPSIPTIGRLIADAPDKMRSEKRFPSCGGRRKMRKSPPKQRKPKGYVPMKPLECTGLDSIEFHGKSTRRYVVTFIDVYSRFAFAFGTRSHTSKETAKVLGALLEALPSKVTNVLTDNGSEFMLHFEDVLKTHGVVHWHTYPRTPKMNAHCERFNRTLQEEFVNRNIHLLFQDLEAFNRKLVEYLEWYNAKRPHKSLGMNAPIQYLLEHLTPEECKTGWTHTKN